MALQTAFPGPDNVTSQTAARKAFAQLLVRDTAGNARPGIMQRVATAAALVTARSDMQVDIAAFEGATVRGGGPLFQANDGTAQATIPTAPGANSRYDIVLFKQNESASPYSDGADTAVFPVYSGAASASPVLATAIADALVAYPGAHPLAAVLLPSGKTATNQSGVVITQLFNYTALNGTAIPVRTAADLAVTTGYAAMNIYRAGTRAIALDTGFEYKWDGSTWKLWNTHGVASYTPTLVGFGLTSTTVTGRYEVINGRVIVDISVSLGASTTMTGNPTASLPTGLDIAASYSSDALLGEALCLVASNNYKTLTVRNSASTVIVFAINVAGTYASLTSLSLTVPAASWGAGAVWRAHAEYDAA